MPRDYFDILASRLMSSSVCSPITDPFDEERLMKQVMEGGAKLIASGELEENKICAQAFAFKTKASYAEMERIADSHKVRCAIKSVVMTIQDEDGIKVEKVRIRTIYGVKKTKGYIAFVIFYELGGKIESPTLGDIRSAAAAALAEAAGCN